MSTQYAVTGMTCGHCAHAVSTEVGAIEGVTAVDVDLETGTLTVEGQGFTLETVGAAVREAGYALA
jgi:copper chaperone